MIMSTGISGTNVSLVLKLGSWRPTQIEMAVSARFLPACAIPFITCDVFVSAPPAVHVLMPLI